MRTWSLLLAGPILWAVHFFTLYIVASVFLTTTLARGLTLAITAACLAAAAFAARRARRQMGETAMDQWVRTVALVGLGISAVAIVWQGLPALLI